MCVNFRVLFLITCQDMSKLLESNLLKKRKENQFLKKYKGMCEIQTHHLNLGSYMLCPHR